MVQGITCGASAGTTPVTVASVASHREPGGGGTVRWSTATETANVGFNVYVRHGDAWQKANDELIPSRVGSSLDTVDYELDVAGLGSEFLIEDVDATGQARRHGPFKVGAAAGQRPEAPAIDWSAVHYDLDRGRRGRGRLVAVTAAAKGGVKGKPPSNDPQVGKHDLALDLRLDRDGLYRVSYEDLAAAGFDLSAVAAGDLALSNRGHAVPIDMEASGRTFGPGSWFEFYGESVKGSLYTDTNVYHLVVDKKAGAVDGHRGGRSDRRHPGDLGPRRQRGRRPRRPGRSTRRSTPGTTPGSPPARTPSPTTSRFRPTG